MRCLTISGLPELYHQVLVVTIDYRFAVHIDRVIVNFIMRPLKDYHNLKRQIAIARSRQLWDPCSID